MTRTEILNAVAAAISAESYLEVGVYDVKRNFKLVKVRRKVGVDPRSAAHCCVLRTTSDDFFERLKAEEGDGWFTGSEDGGDGPGVPVPQTFDLVFVDGDHSEEQVRRDVANALKVLSKNGVVVLHDVLPKTAAEGAAAKLSHGASWCGEVWKVYAHYRGLKSYRSLVVDTDHGVGLLRKAKNDVLPGTSLAAPWEYGFDKNLEELYNLVKPHNFGKALKAFLS